MALSEDEEFELLSLEREKAMNSQQPLSQGQQQPESIANQGLSYVKEHPYKSLLDPIAKTLTGQSISDRVMNKAGMASVTNDADLYGNNPLANAMTIANNTAMGTGLDLAEGLTSPVALLGGLLSKVPGVQQAGQAVANSPVGKAVGEFMTKERKFFGSEFFDINKQLNMAKKEFNAVKSEDLPRKIDESASKVRDTASSLLEKHIDDINNEAENVSRDIKKPLSNWFRNNSKIYGEKLDNISEKLAKSGGSITRGEFKQILDDVLESSQEDFLASGKPFNEISALQKKYNIDESSIDSPILNNNGNPIQTINKTNFSDELNFKEVVNDIKKVKNSLSSKAKSGYKYSPEDVVAAKLMSRWGDFVSQKVPEFAQLNASYKPVIDAMKLSGRLFKPYASEFETKSGTDFLKRLANGKTESGQEALINLIENGTPDFKGIGNITGNLRKIGANKISIENNLNNDINTLMTRKSQYQDLLSRKQQIINRAKIVGGLTAAGAAGSGFLSKAAHADENIDINKINQIESSGNPKAIGDNGKAFGLNQIHLPVLNDFNKSNKKSYTKNDLFNPSKNNEVADWYFNKEIPRLLNHYDLEDTPKNRIIAYNFGIGNLKSGKALPTTTKNYLKKYGLQ